jgi:hypothetical protein
VRFKICLHKNLDGFLTGMNFDAYRRVAKIHFISATILSSAYCLICECYPDGANADDDPMSIDRPRQVAFPACSTRGAVGGSGPT